MSWPDYVQVVFKDRRMGKTSLIMDEIHELAVKNRTAEVLVAVSNMRHRDWWIREWRSKYPALAPPHIISMTNALPIRGRRFEKVYIEDIDIDLEGVYSDRVQDIWPVLAWAREPELIFTCSPLNIVFPDWDELARKQAEEEAIRTAAVMRIWWSIATSLGTEEEAKQMKDFLMLAYMRTKIAQWRQEREEKGAEDQGTGG